MSPISTAQLNPYVETFCLPSPGASVLIPLLLNNTNPHTVRYTLTPLAYSENSKTSGKVEQVDLSAKDLRAIEQGRIDHLQLARAAAKKDYDEYDEYDEEGEEDGSRAGGHALQKTQHLTYVRLNKPGTLRLDRVIDQSNVDARIIFPGEITVVPCPRAVFTAESAALVEDTRCATPRLVSGGGEELQLEIEIFGVPPLSLRWYREVGHRREPFMVEGIEGPEAEEVAHASDDVKESTVGQRGPAQVKVPLTVVLDALGTHSYVLESVTDSLGNVAGAGQYVDTIADARKGLSTRALTTRSVSVLRRPSFSFKHCGPGQPASLLIGSESQVPITAVDADPEDGPWDVAIRYDPPLAEDGSKANKRYKSWTKTLKTQPDRRDVILRAAAPGEYTITGIKGRYCEGDVLSPETCKVVERPLPSAEIEWKKIHEWCVILTTVGLRCLRFRQTAPVTLVSPHLLFCMVHHPSRSTTVLSATRKLPRTQ